MRLISICFWCFVTVLVSSFANEPQTGIYFYPGTFNEAKALAKEQHKIVFVDSYTEWCKPCKQMASEVFTNAEVGSYFNKKFISVKMDMEKTEGMLVGRRYSVNFYPTLLFIKPDGQLVTKAVGMHTKSELLELAKTAN